VCLWSALDDRGAKQVLENVSPSGKQGKLQRHQRRLKNDKKFVYELNRGKFFSKALSSAYFSLKNKFNQPTPAINLQVRLQRSRNAKVWAHKSNYRQKGALNP
jgi:hypothetical protein